MRGEWQAAGSAGNRGRTRGGNPETPPRRNQQIRDRPTVGGRPHLGSPHPGGLFLPEIGRLQFLTQSLPKTHSESPRRRMALCDQVERDRKVHNIGEYAVRLVHRPFCASASRYIGTSRAFTINPLCPSRKPVIVPASPVDLWKTVKPRPSGGKGCRGSPLGPRECEAPGFFTTHC